MLLTYNKEGFYKTQNVKIFKAKAKFWALYYILYIGKIKIN